MTSYVLNDVIYQLMTRGGEFLSLECIIFHLMNFNTKSIHSKKGLRPPTALLASPLALVPNQFVYSRAHSKISVEWWHHVTTRQLFSAMERLIQTISPTYEYIS